MGTILPETKTGKISHYCTPLYFAVVLFLGGGGGGGSLGAFSLLMLMDCSR